MLLVELLTLGIVIGAIYGFFFGKTEDDVYEENVEKEFEPRLKPSTIVDYLRYRYGYGGNDFIDLSNASSKNSRYKEYERLVESGKLTKPNPIFRKIEMVDNCPIHKYYKELYKEARPTEALQVTVLDKKTGKIKHLMLRKEQYERIVEQGNVEILQD
jgi:hypothetical protein